MAPKDHAATFDERAARLFDGTNFAVLSTIEPDGQPHSTVVWAKREGSEVLVALPDSRRKVANLRRDPRATIAVFDMANPYESVQVQGRATLEDDPAGALVDELSHKYTGGPYPGFAGPDPRWVTVRLSVEKVIST